MTTKLPPPHTYQIKCVRTAHRMGGKILLAGDPGIGKTKAAIMYALRHPEARPIVVVCPSHLKYHWQHQCHIHGRLRSEILEGTRPKKAAIRSVPPVTIVNYDILGERRSEHCGEGWLEYLKGIQPSFVILDECHALISRASLRTKSVMDLCKGVPHVMALSGTPLVNRPSELWPTLNILRPDVFKSFWTYAHRFCAAKHTIYGWKFDGASHLDELHTLLTDSCMIRIRREDVLAELPRKRRIVVPLPLSDYEQYAEATDDFIGWLRKSFPKRVRKAKKALAIAKLVYVLQLVARLKLPAVKKWLDEFLINSNEKMNVFAINTEIVRGLHKHYEKLSVVIDGKVSKKDRHLAVKQFLSATTKRFLFGNILAGGTGWSASGVSKTAMVQLTWAPGHIEQAIDRTVGINRGIEGQRSEAYMLLGEATLEFDLLDLLIKKAKVTKKVLDGDKRSVTDFDVINTLADRLLNR